jgi:AraC-like DNA-binding protein
MIEFILLLLGSAHGFYLSFALLTKNNKENNANLLLALLIFSFTLKIFLIFLDVADIPAIFAHLIALDAPIAFLFGPLLYLYVQKLTSSSFYKVNFLHFLPFILAIVISVPFYWQSAEFKLAWLFDTPRSQFGLWYLALFETLFVFLKLVLTSMYLFVVYQRLIRHRKDITDSFSNVEKINLTWLIRLSSAIGFLYLCWLLYEVIEFYLAACSESIIGITCGVLESTADRLMSITEYSLVFCFYLISIYGLKQPAIFSDKSGTRFIETTQRLNNSENANSIIDTQEQQVRKEGKYQKSSLTEELSSKVYQEISRFIHQQNLFLEPELSLSQLALESGFSKHHLSQAINQCANKTFFDFINCLRVDHAKSLLHDENKMNVLEISLASGFNSRSSFYNAFKKHTQLTPSQFKKQRTAKACSA